MTTDCVILAGGRGTRLRGVVPQYFKPLQVVDGQALIVTTIRAVLRLGVGRTIVVVAPENAAPIAHLLDDADLLDEQVFLIVQPTPRGPGDAFLIGSELSQADRVLLLMSDNVWGRGDIERIVSHREDVVIGVSTVSDRGIAAKFTRVTTNGTYEGPDVDDSQRFDDEGYRVWLGPLLVPRKRLREELLGAVDADRTSEEIKIGPWLGNLGPITTVACNTHDVGDVNGLGSGG